MLTVSLVAAAIAALLHLVFFTMESLLFGRRDVWRRFVDTEDAAEALRPVMFNQGFYNLFLALGAGVGVTLVAVESAPGGAGPTLLAFTCASMLGASLVLLATDRRFLAGALIQGVPPAVALGALAAHLAGAG